jgi:hypothetical protein
MPTLHHFPPSLMRESKAQWELVNNTTGGGTTAAGLQPIGGIAGGGLWKCTMQNIPLVTADQVRAWRALEAICDGGAQPIIVPMCDKRFYPAPVVGGARVVSYYPVLHEGGVPFESGVGYHFDVVDATVVEDAALRATSLLINIAYGGDLRGGERFSIDNVINRWRLYGIRTAVDQGSGNWLISIRAPLRNAVVAGTRLNFDQPKCVMRLEKPDSMALMLEMRQRGSASVSFLEAFPPFPV